MHDGSQGRAFPQQRDARQASCYSSQEQHQSKLSSARKAGSSGSFSKPQPTRPPRAYIGLVNVLIRVLRRESGNTDLITLDIRHPAPRPEETAGLIADVARRCFWPATEHQRSLEPEFAYADGRFLIPRVKPDAEFLKWARSGRKLDAAAETTTIPYRGDGVLKAEVAAPGLLSSLRFVEDADAESHDVKPSQSQIVVEAEAHGVNYKDVCVALGQTGPDTQMAGEFSGIVRAVPEDTRHVYEVGDRVVGFGAQPFSNLPRAHGFHAHKIPEWMSATVAASIPHAFITAYHCIVEVSRLKGDQCVLINAASGGVGQVAIQLAQHVGATIFCSISTTAKRRLIVGPVRRSGESCLLRPGWITQAASCDSPTARVSS